MCQSSGSTQENTMWATVSQALVLLLGVVATLFVPCSSSVIQEPKNHHQLSNHNLKDSELLLSVVVNQMTLLRMLNQSSNYCCPNETAITKCKARQEDAKKELRRSLEIALLTIQEKKEEALDELTEKQTAAVIELMGIEQRIEEKLDAVMKATRTRKTFQLFAEPVTHSAAMAACKEKGGQIAVPENYEEDAQLLLMVQRINPGPGRRHYFIGVDDKENEDVWVNSNTGLTLSFTNFHKGEPNDAGTGEDCGTFYYYNPGWYDYPCSSPANGYLCEFTTA